MKKVIVNLLVMGFFFVMIFMAGSGNVKANDTGIIRSGDYEYQIISTENKTAVLRKVYNYGSEVIIPDSIDGYRIVVIGTNRTPYMEKDNVISMDLEKAAILAASDNTVKRLVIPEGVIQIEEFAFNDMNALEELSLPKTLHSIEGSNFENSILLKEITFPAGIHVGRSFRGVVFDRMILNGGFSGYDDDYGDMAGAAKQVKINTDNVRVSFGTGPIDELVIGKNVKNIKLGPCECKNIVLKNPKTILDIFLSPDETDIDKLSAVIKKDIKCKKSSNKYIYSWKPVKIKGKDYTVKYTLSYRKSNGKFHKLKNTKKTSVKLDKKMKLKIDVKVQFKE